jgi:Flp pilus assembly protein TadD
MLTAAIDELEAARRLDPEDVSIRIELATTYLLSDRAEEGQAELSEVLSLTPDDIWSRVLYGLALLEVGSTEEGAEQLHAASLERPLDWELHAAAAMAAAAEGWTDEAWNAVARAELAPGVDPDLIHELEEYVEAGAEAAYEFLHGELVAPMLRARLLGAV